MSRIIRTLSLEEIRLLLDWAAAEGWNPGLDDAVAFQAADPHGFFGAFVDGNMVAAISAVAYDDHYGFIGLYICHPNWRGQGHGRAVWDAGMSYLGDRTIGLDGVAEQRANYARMGFVPAHETVRMSGTITGTAPVRPDHGDFTDILALDRRCFPAGREEFLRHWAALPNQLLLQRRNGDVNGYAVLRACRDGAKLGPVFADSTADAIALLGSISGTVHLDVPETRADWLEALADRGLQPGFRTTRMYRGAPPAALWGHVFGVTSLELG